MSPPTLFPTYLLPSLPFRRRKSSTDSTESTASASLPTASTTSTYLSGHTSHLRCARCLADLALSSQIISKGFTGRHGRAYLVGPPPTDALSPQNIAGTPLQLLPNLPNTYTHKPVPRHLVTGAHTVSDIACAHCSSTLGWKYVAAEQEAQRYKVGKFILETKKVCRGADWQGGGELTTGRAGRSGESAEIEFDSQDEDECEDLFLGVWNPRVAVARRKRKGLLD
nr:putative yippee-like protein [Quercus suber]